MQERMPDSRDVARAAIMLALSTSREDEAAHKQQLAGSHIRSAASDCGGDFSGSVMKIIERAVVIAKREGLISDKAHEEGAVAGAAHDAVIQLADKALGLNVGGKIGVARADGHVAVAIFFTVGLVHLNEVCVGLGHRAV